tara:strand:+ start:3032 stop:3349 length:318 start_codon:yes stop_codon:yes gene_type:complete
VKGIMNNEVEDAYEDYEELVDVEIVEKNGNGNGGSDSLQKISKHHTFVCETLYHYNCGECNCWWSYAATPNKKNLYLGWEMIGKHMHCPHCGVEAELKMKNGFEI